MKPIVLFLFFVLGLTCDGYADETPVFIYNEHGKRDPFGPLVSQSGALISYDIDSAPSDMTLEGIVLDAKGNNLAILNGKIVKVGDKSGTAVVAAIFNDHIDLIKGQEHITVKLKKGAL
jgi:hypothetical protein